MTVDHAIIGTLGAIAAILVVRELRLAREAVRNGRCIICGAPAEGGECDECWWERASK